jgi:NAD(P)-dependent dehydrogenase (short-subunit alcohol dehydrogenase family)
MAVFPVRFRDMGAQGRDRQLQERVQGRTVLITGASSGIGRALAIRLGIAGAKLVLVARSPDKLEETKGAVESAGGRAFVYPCDLSSAEETEQLVRSVLSEHGQVDVLVNNAGRSIRRSVAGSYDRLHDFERTFALNFFGALRLILGFLPQMRERRSGQIINVSTLGVQISIPRYGAYIASKAALDAFSRVLTAETLGEGVTVTTVYMPLVKTPMVKLAIYKEIPMRSADEGASLIIDGIIDQKKRVATPVGTLFELAHVLAPKHVDRFLHAGYEIFPESGERKDMRLPRTHSFALLMRALRWAASR